MIELPEAINIAQQLNETVSGKRISGVIAGHTLHKLVWYYGDTAKYASLLVGKTVNRSVAYGGMIETTTSGDGCILLGEGSNIRFHRQHDPRPDKHQLLIEFDDGCALSSAVQMYGGMGCYPAGELDNKYYKVAKEKPSPLSTAFDRSYFDSIISAPEARTLSLKAVLATEQRIPGLGNGVLQDILFHARFHPKKKLSSFSGSEIDTLFNSVKTILSAMTDSHGRDTELDLFGRPGGYKTILSKNTAGKPCPVCGTAIKKEAYLGGSIYYCEKCQLV
jgi:formamidopyrimidine-DNA glycosylase